MRVLLIYPHTTLARIAVSEGVIASEADLLLPKFYMAENLKARLLETVTNWMKDRPNWLR
jgi:hypothetical protein